LGDEKPGNKERKEKEGKKAKRPGFGGKVRIHKIFNPQLMGTIKERKEIKLKHTEGERRENWEGLREKKALQVEGISHSRRLTSDRPECRGGKKLKKKRDGKEEEKRNQEEGKK